ncbi:hypothetical protein BDW74DRAFT_158272 [Aspergillus multicolor]|uniref:uncharacterized protein n=1 Tax=Aspergillus multicolor TaxID=41759 RepID=UPI003CCCF85F
MTRLLTISSAMFRQVTPLPCPAQAKFGHVVWWCATAKSKYLRLGTPKSCRTARFSFLDSFARIYIKEPPSVLVPLLLK